MSIRLRLALVVALTAAVLVAAAGFGLAAEVGSGIRATLRDSLRRSVVRVSRDLAAGSLPLDRRGGRVTLARDQTVVQVLSGAGSVEYSTEAAGRSRLLSSGELGSARRGSTFVQVTRPGWRNPRLLLAEPLAGPRREIVLVGASLDEVDHSTVLLEDGLVLVGPAVVLLAGLGGWLIAGRALEPVERLRAAAESLSGGDHSSGLAVPRTHDELERLAKTLNDLLARLHGALCEQRAFVAAASHELMTPLAAVRAELEVAGMAGASEAERRQALEVVETRVDQLVRLTRDLLLLAVSDERATTLELVAQPVEPILAESLRGFRARADACRVALLLDADPGVACAVDAEQLRRVVDNLVANALEYASTGSLVEVHLGRESEQAVLEVRDKGPGFPSWFLAHAFERFSRAEVSRPTSQGAGAGLGLAIVRALVEAHGGLVSAGNRPEGGAVMRVMLPLAGSVPSGAGAGPAPQAGSARARGGAP